jgi:hypothetical protein
MRKAAIFLVAIMLAGCDEGSRLRLDLPALTLVNTAEAEQIDPGVTREQFCRFAREAIGLPVLLNSNLRSEAYAALGREKASQLFRPIARANNSFRCICGTPDERAIAKC